MASRSDIVITGTGIVSPIGIGSEPFWAALCEGRSGIRRLTQFDSPILPPVLGGEVADFDPKQYVRPRKSLKVMSRDVQLGFTAADLACADSRLRETPVDPERMGVMLGADLISCELDELVGTYHKCIVDGRFDFDRWGAAAKAELYPLWMLKYLPNMPACHIGIAQDARGPNNTITLGDVSTLLALAEATRVLERGHVDAIIAGGVNSRLNPMLWVRSRVFGQSRWSGDPTAASRPFDATRDGLVDGEGAAAFILETRPHAESRGATILGRICGFSSIFQPSANGQPRLDVAIARAIATALASAGLKPTDVGFVVAHGMGTIDGDRFEAKAIREVLGDVPVTAPKSYFGYLGAASGALETAVGLMSLQNGQVPPTLNYEHADPQCPINVVHGRPLPIERSTALILSYSPQGQAAALVLGGGSD